MRSQLVIAALAASVSASANLFPGHMAIRRDLLVARQTEPAAAPTATSGDSSEDDCQDAILSIATNLPMPNSDLIEWEQGNIGSNICDATSVPASLSSDYASYTSAVFSWYSASSAELMSAISSCPEYAAAVSEITACSSDLTAEASATAATADATTTHSGSAASATGSSTGTATGSGSPSSAGPASASSSVATAGAPLREAGIVGAVLAGVLGVAVAL